MTLDKYIPNRACCGDAYTALYEFVGRLMGVAIRSENPLSLDLASLVWKPLVGTPLDIHDLQATDELCVGAMRALLDDKALAEKGVNHDNFEDIYGFSFTYASSDGSVVDLVPDGSHMPVRWQDRHEYARLVIDFRLRELAPQIAAIRRGLLQVIPARGLALLTWKELELEVCGNPEIDVQLLKVRITFQRLLHAQTVLI